MLLKKKKCYFLHPAAAYGIAWVSRLILWDTTENMFFSFSKNMQVFMISTYTSQKPVILRQPLHHTEHVGVIIYKVHRYMHAPTCRKEAQPWRMQEPKHWFPVFGWHHWFTICCWTHRCLKAFTRLLVSLLHKLREDTLLSGDPQNKMFHNWFCWAYTAACIINYFCLDKHYDIVWGYTWSFPLMTGAVPSQSCFKHVAVP